MSKIGIEIQQYLKNGILSGPHQSKFSIVINSVSFDISIEQIGTRKTTITTNSSIELDELIKLFNELDMLLMLSDGQFMPIIGAKLLKNEIFTESDTLDTKLATRPKMFDSSDFVLGNHSTFLSFDKYLNDRVFDKWITIYKELDITHHMVLYSLADTGMPIDYKCAFLIESFKVLFELIEKYDLSFKRPQGLSRNELKLRQYIKLIIEKYGRDIFHTELNSNVEKIAKVFVHSRNRIAHIKSKQNQTYLSGSESILYAVKISFLYRTVGLSNILDSKL